MTGDDQLSARERIDAHRLCREAEALADRAPWAAWILRPLAHLIRWMDAELEGDRHDADY